MRDHMPLRLAGFVLWAWCAMTFVAGAQTERDGADDETLVASLVRKMATIIEYAVEDPETLRETRITEAELNAFLTSGAALPAGVSEPIVELAGEGRATGRAVVDLDRVREGRQGGWLDPTSYLSGRVPVSATGVLRAQDGVARVDVERVEVGGVPVPAILLRELVATYTKSADRPDGMDVDGEHPLPYGIREIQIHAGSALIVQ